MNRDLSRLVRHLLDKRKPYKFAYGVPSLLSQPKTRLSSREQPGDGAVEVRACHKRHRQRMHKRMWHAAIQALMHCFKVALQNVPTFHSRVDFSHSFFFVSDNDFTVFAFDGGVILSNLSTPW